ncbi:MAG: heavy metal sensor histidine kinase [Betaproteobacteria bacterium]|nr:heavy metal sensor histidine kinase [Betaproteobacteria bacterium]
MSQAPSLTVRLALLFAAVSTTVLLTLGTVIGYLVEEHFEMLDMVELSGKLTLIEHVLARSGVVARSDELARQLNEALVGHHGLSVAVYAGQGQVLYASADADFPPRILHDNPGGLLARPMHPVVWENQGRTFRSIAASMPATAEIPAHSVALALDMAHHQEFMSAFRRMLWAALALGIVLSSLLGWLAARRGLAPVRAMAGIARSISAERLDARLPLQSVPVEVQELASSFNAMLARLEESFKRLSEFSSDIAHELRTPVSNLMTQTQVAVSKARSADEYREILYSNLEEYDRLARMIADMLLLAKTDNPLLTLRRDPIDLAAEIDPLLDFYQALADEQGVHVARGGDGRIVGDASMIRRALSNLLSNAIRHTPRGGSVSIGVDSGSGRCRIRVENTGDTIPAEHLPRLFDRFYRVDPARSRGSDGAGLGLAIVKAIVEAHAGHIEVSSTGGVTAFVMSMPVAAEHAAA